MFSWGSKYTSEVNLYPYNYSVGSVAQFTKAEEELVSFKKF